MSTLLIIIGGLFLVVMGRSILDPWPSPIQCQATKARARTMQVIANTVF